MVICGLACSLSLRVIGLPGEEDWPIESPVCYSPKWAENKPTKQLLPNLGHEENDLLSVSYSYLREILVTGTQNTHTNNFSCLKLLFPHSNF